ASPPLLAPLLPLRAPLFPTRRSSDLAAPSGTAPPWCPRAGVRSGRAARGSAGEERSGEGRCHAGSACSWGERAISGSSMVARRRSEEHTSELQSRFDLVCRLLLEKEN